METFFSRAASHKGPAAYGLDQAIKQAAEEINQCYFKTSVFTGAGISVESGIPDFRSPGGLWSKYDPFIYCHIENFRHSPHLFWQMARESILQTHIKLGGTLDALLKGKEHTKYPEPNSAHIALSELQKLDVVKTIITQNIDGLHQAAGSSNVVELHGNIVTSTCQMCLKTFSQRAVLEQWRAFSKDNPETSIEEDKWYPSCDQCRGPIKADVTFFGEALPPGALSQAFRAVFTSSTCLVIGSSLSVTPAAMVPSIVKMRFGKIILINKDGSGKDVADIFLQGSAGEILPKLVREIKVLRKNND